MLKAFAEASAVFVTLTYVAGWSYLSSYYEVFGVNPLELDISVPVVSTLALDVLYGKIWLAVIVVILVIAVATAITFFHKQRRGIVAAALFLTLSAAMGVGGGLGRSLAKRDVLSNSADLPFVAFAAKAEMKHPEPSCVDVETYGTIDCKLLLHMKNTYYFFQPIPQSGVGGINLYTLNESEVLGVHVQRGLDRRVE